MLRASLLLLVLAGPAWAQIVIHEIHYNPRERGQALEFVELWNARDHVIDLSGWKFDEGVNYAFPEGSKLEPKALLVVAQDPSALKEAYNVDALGPWEGKLSNRGETLTLRDASGKKQDEVDYGIGFPWPTAAAGAGASMELIHPDLDNNLAGSWRSSIAASPSQEDSNPIALRAQSKEWRYLKGLTEPPATWNTIGFDDRRWTKAQTPIGYADGDDRTLIKDMLGRYTTVYLRHTLHIDATQSLETPLSLGVYSDDGAVVWINGKEVMRLRVTKHSPSHLSRTTQNHEAAWESQTLTQPKRYLHHGKNVIAILGVNGDPTSSDFSIDARLQPAPADAIAAQPSPGRPNRAAVQSPPPQIRQVKHAPKLPKSGQAVTISAKVTDPNGVARVTLWYQSLVPGDYVSKNDPRFETLWKSLPMNLEDGLYTASLPTDLQKHRHAVRYRIAAEDKYGAKVWVPYADDAQSNFAYYCYNDAPAWTGADIPGRTPEKTFSQTTMNGAPMLHLIATEEDVMNSQYDYRYNERYLYGTLVVGNRVYDHIRFRNRGETTTYQVGKNKWRINFNRTRELPASTLDGKRDHSRKRLWKRLNLNPGTMPYDAPFRGNAALNERLAFRLYQLAGIPTSDTCYAQFRVIDDLSEEGKDQYSGDLWGLYMAFEAVDGYMLDNNDEPDSELIHVKQSGNRIARTPLAPDPHGMDYREFWNALRQNQSADWWERHVDLERYYSYHAISLATARVDQKLNHNHFLYRHPKRGWQVLPWDADMCLQPIRYQPNQLRWHPMLKYCLDHSRLRIAYQNRGRELLDLLFQKDQITSLVDELVEDLGPIDQQASLAEVDRFLWNYHPKTKSGHRGTFYQQSIASHRFSREVRFDNQAFAGRVNYFKDYLTQDDPSQSRVTGKLYRGWGYSQLSRDTQDANIPRTPSIKRDRSADKQRFLSSPFQNRQGKAAFEAIEWRIALEKPNSYEIRPLWQSKRLGSEGMTFSFPLLPLETGKTYRVRTRHIDTVGHASHWSAPLSFLSESHSTKAFTDALIISEIMFHPREGWPEYVELANIGEQTLDLTPLQFTRGISFDFGQGKIKELAPGERLLVVDNEACFASNYPQLGKFVTGAWDTGKLSNKGERLVLSHGPTTPVITVRYDDSSPWPQEADGSGCSLEFKTLKPNVDPSQPEHWKASAAPGGTPGR